MISQSVDSKKWKPIKVGKDCPGLSHFFFTDDLFLFGQATESQACTIKEIIDGFCAVSGAKVSLDKSKLFISPKANKDNMKKVAAIMDMALTSDLGKYLGVPLIHGKVSKAT